MRTIGLIAAAALAALATPATLASGTAAAAMSPIVRIELRNAAAGRWMTKGG